MIDTVRFIPTNCEFQGAYPKNWNMKQTTIPETRGPNGVIIPTRNYFQLRETEAGVYVRIQPSMRIDCVQISLPRILFGNNGKLLKSQDEINAAMEAVDQKLRQIAEFHSTERLFTRIDLALHFVTDPDLFMRAHQTFRFPGIRSGPLIHQNESLFWSGKYLKVRMYDKTREQTRKQGEIIRLEFQLQGEKLRKTFNGNHTPVAALDFGQCYKIYRNFALNFAPSRLPKITTIGELLAIGEVAKWHYSGQSAFQIYTRELCSKRINQLRKEIAAKRVEHFEIDWPSLLPESGPLFFDTKSEKQFTQLPNHTEANSEIICEKAV